jgi:hypothetical protein
VARRHQFGLWFAGNKRLVESHPRVAVEHWVPSADEPVAMLQHRRNTQDSNANLHPDHDTIAVFRRSNKAAFEAAFLHVLLLARESGLLRLGTVSIDGTKTDANASKLRSVRYDRAKELRAKLAADIAALTAQAEAADAADHDPQALPAELARREVLKAKLNAACERLEAEARTDAQPPDDEPPPERQCNLTDPDRCVDAPFGCARVSPSL